MCVYTLELFTLLNAKGKKELIEWCMKEGLIASSYEYPCNDRHDVTWSAIKHFLRNCTSHAECHMEEIKDEALDKINYYIPHHSVYKPEKTSTPFRVVFDGSAKATSGFSLNSILLNGGIIQQDLFSN
ncbi:integrase catalytic domain-containing protein [Trichonephila clavipes]|nr:integrase catalytic domain-containing protein [Trichonephila clavipes]